MIEPELVALLKQVCPRSFPDDAPAGTARPYVIYQVTGGKPQQFIDAKVSNLRNAEVQIEVWADTRSEATTLMLAIEKALVETSGPLQVAALGGMMTSSEPGIGLYQAQQDFSLWGSRE